MTQPSVNDADDPDVDLGSAVTAWIAEDPDAATRCELSDLLTAHTSGDTEATAG